MSPADELPADTSPVDPLDAAVVDWLTPTVVEARVVVTTTQSGHGSGEDHIPVWVQRGIRVESRALPAGHVQSRVRNSRRSTASHINPVR